MEEKLEVIKNVLLNPEQYVEHEHLSSLARAIVGKPKIKTDYEVHMLKHSGDFSIYGQRHISQNAILQMESAMSLPISVKGALMPDAHQGYGLPIGGVLATSNAVIPFGVGLDIGCRMALSIYALPENYIQKKEYDLQKALRRYTHFGNEGTLDFDVDHEVLERPEFQATELLKRLHGKAWYQLGSSGTGNHFVEFGTVEIHADNNLNVAPGNYIGLLSHSGSRGMGAAIAAIYTKIATQKCKLPRELQSMAWLNLDEEAGQEYWLSMNLAGDYAKACHDVIHKNLERVMGLEAICKVENHHNFAWKEVHNGQELIVHRKGATPAALGELGIIPGSMTSKGYIVSGLGLEGSLNSASHGAGRKMSRTEARESITKSSMTANLAEHKTMLIGGSVEEASTAYKDIEVVMQSQQNLVKVEGSFTPKIVRMNKKINKNTLVALRVSVASVLKTKKMENYIIHITSGKGPAECCLAVALALKELLKEAEENKLQTSIIERIQGMENRTLLSATVVISGSNAKPFCNSWTGVVLWICQSPFRKLHKRKNWFIGIQSFDESNFAKWNERDLSFQTMRSSGPGGQNVNKVESAVRATHKPSGLIVMVNESRSQLQNKKLAIERLKFHFEQWVLKQALEKQQQLWQQNSSLERGNPSRIYEGLTFKRNKNGE